MKKFKVIPLLALTPFLLTACSQKISSDQFANELANVKTSLDNKDAIVDVHINNKLSVNSYDYKVGEFYSYSFLGILGIGSERIAIWKEEGKYYHYHTSPLNRDAKVTEIDESQFNDYMSSYKSTILEQLNYPYEQAYLLLNNMTPYEQASSRYFKSVKKEYSIKSTISKSVHDNYDENGNETLKSVTDEYEIAFKDALPETYYSKVYDASGSSSETKWTYSYGKATFNKPSVSQ